MLVVDDNHGFRMALAGWVESQDDLDLTGTAANGAEAVGAVRETRPDIVVMDAYMPEMDGFEATRILKGGPRPPFVVMTSLHPHVRIEEEARQAGADAFIPKDRLASGLRAALDAQHARR